MIIDKRQRYDSATLAVGCHVWVDIRAPIELVFNFLSRAEGLTRWWSSTCQADPAPGGHIQFGWQGENETTGDAIFRRFEPPTQLTWEWTYRNQELIACNGADHRGMRWPALCEFELATLTSQQTRVHLHDWGIAGGAEFLPVRQATQDGWMQSMNRLKKVCEFAFRQHQARKVRQRNGSTNTPKETGHEDDTV